MPDEPVPDSPAFTPQSLRDFKARGSVRRNREKPIENRQLEKKIEKRLARGGPRIIMWGVRGDCAGTGLHCLSTRKADEKMMILRIAKATKIYKDYGSELGRVHGIVWIDSNGYPVRGAFEAGRTLEEKLEKMQPYIDQGLLEVEVCEHVALSSDMNPHGFL